MRERCHKYHNFICIFFICSFLLFMQTLGFAAKKDKDKQKSIVMTEIELQSQLMSYADRFASILAQAFEDFDALNPSPESRHFVLEDMAYAMSAVFTTAGEPNPQAALLDMVVITTLGRMVYEDNIRRRYGKPIEVMAQAFGQLEKDIWQITARILSIAQQQELRGLIRQWREQNPDKVVYSHIRFSNFAADRRKSTLVKKDKAGGLFKSVQEATQQVEETRMLAERGLYLATRMPLLTGAFSEVWLTQLLVNPEVKKILSDINRFSTVSERLANVAEQLPEQVAFERSAAIDQFMYRLREERKTLLSDLMAEEERIKDLVTEVRLTVVEGNHLLQSASALSEQLNLDFSQSAEDTVDSEPFDLQAYRATMADVSKVVEKLTKLLETTNRLLASGGLEKLFPQLDKSVDNVERESEELVDHTVRQAILLIVIAMVAYIIARLVYTYLHKRLV